jgi:hypothetical protein
MFLKAVHLPEYRPEEPDPNDKSQLPDEETWLFDEYDKLRECILKVIDPLKAYKETYSKYSEEYACDPAAVIA